MRDVLLQFRFVMLAILLVVFSVSAVLGATITVRKDGSGDFGVIQAAMDVAAAGDTVLIGPGEYVDVTMIRPPAFSFDMRSYCDVRVDNLTIIGAGAGQTILGPVMYAPTQWPRYDPKGISNVGHAEIRIQGLTVRNCYLGIWTGGNLFVDDCEFIDNAVSIGNAPSGTNSWVRNSQFDCIGIQYEQPDALAFGSPGSNLLVENCQFAGAQLTIQGNVGFRMLNCDMRDNIVGVEVYYTYSTSLIQNCTMTNMDFGVSQSWGGGYCEVRDSSISGRRSTIRTGTEGRLLVENSILSGGEQAVLHLVSNPDVCIVHNSDIIKGPGPAVLCSQLINPVVHDLTNNYWGTSNAADIAQWITDKNDDPAILAEVLYDPFSGSALPAENKSWGSVKALFR